MLHNFSSHSQQLSHHRCFLWYLRLFFFFLIKQCCIFPFSLWKSRENNLLWQLAEQFEHLRTLARIPDVFQWAHLGSFPWWWVYRDSRNCCVSCFCRAAGVMWSGGGPRCWSAFCSVPWVTWSLEPPPTCSYLPSLESPWVSSCTCLCAFLQNKLLPRTERACPTCVPKSASLITAYVKKAEWQYQL